MLSGSDTPRRLIVGSGHAGPAWLGCALTEGASVPTVGEGHHGLAALPAVARAFGRAGGGLQTELSADYPGVLWPTGELGHAVGIAQGFAQVRSDERVVCLIGDGELEAGATLPALLSAGSLRSPPVIVVNLNGLRMDGPSELGRRSADERAEVLRGFGIIVHRCAVDDLDGLADRIANAARDTRPTAVLLEGQKGAGCPQLPDGTVVEGQERAHKTVVPTAGFDAEGISWLQEWLASTRPTWLPAVLAGGESPMERWLPEPALRVARPVSASSVHRKMARTPSNPDRLMTATASFAAALRASDEPCLVTSPDELSSNRLSTLRDVDSVEILEILNEAACLDWSLGAIIGQRVSWHIAYEAFAPLVASHLAQHLKFLDHARRASAPLPRSLGVFLTSLGWRNVASHRDTSIHSTLLSAESEHLRLVFPVTSAAVSRAVRLAAREDGLVVVICGDKTIPLRGRWRTDGPVPTLDASNINGPPDIVIVVCGDVAAREAERAHEWFGHEAPGLRVRVLAIEDISATYRNSDDARELRTEVATACSRAGRVYVAAPHVGAFVRTVLLRLVGPGAHLLGEHHHHPDAQPGLDGLLAAQSTWIDYVEAISRAASETVERSRTHHLPAALVRLEELRATLISTLDDDLDDWYGGEN